MNRTAAVQVESCADAAFGTGGPSRGDPRPAGREAVRRAVTHPCCLGCIEHGGMKNELDRAFCFSRFYQVPDPENCFREEQIKEPRSKL